MTVRAVDMQIVVQKAAEVVKNRHQEDSKTRLQLQQQAQLLTAKQRVENRQIKDVQKTEKSMIHINKDKSGSRQNRGQDSKKERKDKETGSYSSGTIDINI